MRDQFIKDNVDKDAIAESLTGDFITFVWQLDK